jgi:hypothetical protein
MEPLMTQFLAERFAGLQFHSGCSTIGNGGSIKPARPRSAGLGALAG